ncbi:MAG: aconitate hydratase 2/2-methylisocitrate dehydratase, partial [Gammaproteobacteria bacterium]
MLQAYREHIDERAKEGIPPLPLNAQQVALLVELAKNPPAGEENYLLELLTQNIPAGVDEAAYVKAGFLAAVSRGEVSTSLIDAVMAVEILGSMLGGYNI